MRESDKDKNKWEKNGFTTSKCDWNFDNGRRVLQIHPTCDVSNKISKSTQKLYNAKEGHIVIVVAKERSLFEVRVLRYFDMEHVHTKKTNTNHEELNNWPSKCLSVLYFIPTNPIYICAQWPTYRQSCHNCSYS